jgi:opacity protein-like surface antigen
MSESFFAIRSALVMWAAVAIVVIGSAPARSQGYGVVRAGDPVGPSYAVFDPPPFPKHLLDDLDWDEDACDLIARTKAEEDWQSRHCHDFAGFRTPWGGPFLGGGVALSSLRVDWTETSRPTGIQTLQATDTGSGAAGRIEFGAWIRTAGFTLTPRNGIEQTHRDGPRLVIGAKAQIDIGGSRVSHYFPGGSVIESDQNVMFSILGMAGISPAPGVAFYALAGPSIGQQRLHIFLGGPDTWEYRTATGATVGVGAQFPTGISGLSISAEYQHTFMAKTHEDAPAASPASNYAFLRDSDTLSVTARFKLGGPPKSYRVETPYPVKAPRISK